MILSSPDTLPGNCFTKTPNTSKSFNKCVLGNLQRSWINIYAWIKTYSIGNIYIFWHIYTQVWNSSGKPLVKQAPQTMIECTGNHFKNCKGALLELKYVISALHIQFPMHTQDILCGISTVTYEIPQQILIHTQIAKFMGPTWGPPGSCRPHFGSMHLAIRVYLKMPFLL